MNTGSKTSSLSPDQVIGRLCAAMAAGNFDILNKNSNGIYFRHGTLWTQTPAMLPKQGTIAIKPVHEGTYIEYRIGLYGFAKYWLLFFAIAFCWLIFPPIIIYLALRKHPDRLMKNLLNAV